MKVRFERRPTILQVIEKMSDVKRIGPRAPGVALHGISDDS
jgi:hypothetical protein